MRKRKTNIQIFFTLVLMLVAFALPATAQEGSPILIGILEPQTGSHAVSGAKDIMGEELAIDHINELGGVLGRPLKGIFEDTQSRPEAAMEAVRKLIDINKVSVIIGPHTSGETIPTSTYAGSKGIPQISVSATSPKVRELGPHHFSVVGLDDLVGKFMAQFCWEDAGVEKWGIMTANTDYGLGIGRVMQEELEELGGEVVGFVAYEGGKTDYRAELERLFTDKPEAIIIVTWGEMAFIQFKQAYEMGLLDQAKDKWYSPYPSNITTGVPETIEGVKGLDVAWGSPRGEHFAEIFKKKFPDKEPNAYSARTYDAVWIAALAMNISGSTDPKRIMEVLPFVFDIYRGVFSGNMSVDEDGMPKKQPCWAWIVRNGKLEMYTDKVYGI